LRFFGFLAVFAASLNAAAVGAPLDPTFRILSGVSPRFFCALILLRLAWMFAYKPRLLAIRLALTLFLFAFMHPRHNQPPFLAFALAVLLRSLK
tara:strand:- start:1882 stop:2163 length:282 start_codon:yes stop_codon:yes gene_type:complete